MKDIIYGIHTISNILKYNPKRILRIFILRKQYNKLNLLINKIVKQNININLVTDKWFYKNIKGVHQGIAAEINNNFFMKNYNLSLILEKKDPLILILDKITDPHNLGACIRVAEAINIDCIILPKKRSAKLNSTVYKVSSGAIENVKIITVNSLNYTLNILKNKNINIIGADNNSLKNLYETKFNLPIALIIGSENYGINKINKKSCDQLIKIPMFGNINSLNLSVATGIFLYEIIRQKNFKK